MQGGCCKELKMWIWSKFSSILMRIRECSWPPQVILLPLLSLYYYLLPTMIPSHVEYKQSKTSHTIFKVSNILRLWQITLQNGKCIWALSGMQILLRPISVADIYISFRRNSKERLTNWQVSRLHAWCVLSKTGVDKILFSAEFPYKFSPPSFLFHAPPKASLRIKRNCVRTSLN